MKKEESQPEENEEPKMLPWEKTADDWEIKWWLRRSPEERQEAIDRFNPHPSYSYWRIIEDPQTPKSLHSYTHIVYALARSHDKAMKAGTL